MLACDAPDLMRMTAIRDGGSSLPQDVADQADAAPVTGRVSAYPHEARRSWLFSRSDDDGAVVIIPVARALNWLHGGRVQGGSGV